MLKSFTQELHTMWDLYLDSCLFAYRISQHASTGYTTIPSDLGSLNTFNNTVTTNDNYVGKLKETKKNSLDIAKTKTQEAQEKQKQYYDGLRTRKNSISPIPINSNMSTSQSLRNCKKYFNRYSKHNQLPSYMSQPSQVSLNEHSFSRLHESNISTPSPSVPATFQQGQSVNQLPPFLPKSIIQYKLHIRVSLQICNERRIPTSMRYL
ncbi:hypothetical protein ACTFIY_006525 [Dictyostelium cf. discoideum]